MRKLIEEHRNLFIRIHDRCVEHTFTIISNNNYYFELRRVINDAGLAAFDFAKGVYIFARCVVIKLTKGDATISFVLHGLKNFACAVQQVEAELLVSKILALKGLAGCEYGTRRSCQIAVGESQSILCRVNDFSCQLAGISIIYCYHYCYFVLCRVIGDSGQISSDFTHDVIVFTGFMVCDSGKAEVAVLVILNYLRIYATVNLSIIIECQKFETEHARCQIKIAGESFTASDSRLF